MREHTDTDASTASDLSPEDGGIRGTSEATHPPDELGPAVEESLDREDDDQLSVSDPPEVAVTIAETEAEEEEEEQEEEEDEEEEEQEDEETPAVSSRARTARPLPSPYAVQWPRRRAWGGADTPEAARIADWSQALFDELLPRQDRSRTAVLLACDDETVRIAGERLGGVGGKVVSSLVQDATQAYGITERLGLRTLGQLGGAFENQPRPRALPEYFAGLCVLVLAASRMAADESHATSAYYVRLRDLLSLPGEGALQHFRFVPRLFAQLDDWLAHDLAGRHGRLILPEDPSPRYVGVCVSQTVFRKRDREVLSEFFAARMGVTDGYDPLRRLLRWPGRRHLTRHALDIVEDASMADRVRAAIRSAYASWDGSVISAESGGRVWPARLRLLPHPPRLRVGAANRDPITFPFDGVMRTLEPGGEVALSWSVIETLRGETLVFGQPDAPEGAVRLPAVDDTVVFELDDDGLVRTERPAAETVWLVTRQESLHRQLESFRVEPGETLPEQWLIFRDVPITELGIARSLALNVRAPLALVGGLPLETHVYLDGGGPRLEVGDLDELEGQLSVLINGEAIHSVGSGAIVQLPGEPGVYEVVVGDDEWRVRYHVEERGEPAGVGSLGHSLTGPGALLGGARPLRSDGKRSVCGAALSDTWVGELPFLTRVDRVVTINDEGVGLIHVRPVTPGWFSLVGFDGPGRWEVVRDRLVWVIHQAPHGARGWVRQIRPMRFERLDEPAARAVIEVGEEPLVRAANESSWHELIAVAHQTETGGSA